MSINKKIIIILLIIFSCLFLSFIIYFGNYYHASKEAKDDMVDSDVVKVKKIKEGYFFDGPGSDTAIIFYPGAKVETKAYARLMNMLSSNNVDTFLVDMPFRFAFFGSDKASSIIDNYQYKHYGLMGHSLGGVVASTYANKNTNIEYLILLASYPASKLNNIKFLSIYGNKDTVLNIDAYEKNKKYWPKESYEKVIVDGNHAKYGDYGKQKGDSKTTLSNFDQQEITTKYIIDFLEV